MENNDDKNLKNIKEDESKINESRVIIRYRFIPKKDDVSLIKSSDGYYSFKNTKVIKLFPHSKSKIPFGFYKHIENKLEFDHYNLMMNDIAISDLFIHLKGRSIFFPYSKLYVDVERLIDENKEIMAKVGQGVFYKNYFDLKEIKFIDVNKMERVNKERYKLYNKYHETIERFIDRILSIYKRKRKILLLDIHSYSTKMAKTTLRILKNNNLLDENISDEYIENEENYPDVCLGINEGELYKCKPYLIEIVKFLNAHHLSFKINFPYKGSLMIEKYKTNPNIISIMIEVNKRLYL